MGEVGKGEERRGIREKRREEREERRGADDGLRTTQSIIRPRIVFCRLDPGVGLLGWRTGMR